MCGLSQFSKPAAVVAEERTDSMASDIDAEADPTAHVLIIGGGASGTTCALFLARAGITSTIFHHDRTILKRAFLHNFPGEEPILGVDWLAETRAAVAATGKNTLVQERVTAIATDGEAVSLETASGPATGDYLVIASGQLSIPFAESTGLATTDPAQPFVTTNIVVDHWGATNLARVFACGVVAGFPSQAVICAGSGANVAVGIASQVRGSYWVDHDTAPVVAEEEPE
jgi:thioredoxin reductase